jgi:hypothetical protein
LEVHRAVGRGDLEQFVVLKLTDVEDCRALAQRQLRPSLVERHHVERRGGLKPCEVAAREVNRGARVFPRVEAIPDRERRVRRQLDPLRFGRVRRDVAAQPHLTFDTFHARGARQCQRLRLRFVSHPERGDEAAERGEDQRRDRQVRPHLKLIRASAHDYYTSITDGLIRLITSQEPCRRAAPSGAKALSFVTG